MRKRTLKKEQSTIAFNQKNQSVPLDYYEHAIRHFGVQKFWHMQRVKAIKKLFGAANKAAILDIGCNSGTTTNFFTAYGTIVGLDILGKNVLYGRKHYPKINFAIGDGQYLPFANNSFDVVICLETLEHIFNPYLLVKEVHRVLKTNGIFILEVQDDSKIIWKLIWWTWQKTTGKIWRHSHFHKFNRKTLIKILSPFFQIKLYSCHLKLSIIIKGIKKSK